MMTEETIAQLKTRHIRVRGHRTSVRCDDETWEALKEIATTEGVTINHLCTEIANNKPCGLSLTVCLRTFALSYFMNQCRRLSGSAGRAPH